MSNNGHGKLKFADRRTKYIARDLSDKHAGGTIFQEMQETSLMHITANSVVCIKLCGDARCFVFLGICRACSKIPCSCSRTAMEGHMFRGDMRSN